MVKPAQPRSSEGSYDLDGLNAANQREVVADRAHLFGFSELLDHDIAFMLLDDLFHAGYLGRRGYRARRFGRRSLASSSISASGLSAQVRSDRHGPPLV
jgi:hypothetical protein